MTVPAGATAEHDRSHDHDGPHDHDLGLRHDVDVLVGRRKLLGLLGGITVAGALAACGQSSSTSSGSSPSASASTSTSASTGGSVDEVPDETAGPYPGDGSNGPNSLDDSGIVRSDIRSSYDISTNVAEGVPLTIRLTTRDAATGDALAGAAVYLWHCDRDGGYSLYTVPEENYLRGVQESRLERHGGVHVDVPRLLRRALAAHPLRGLLLAGRRHDLRSHREDVADRPAEGGVRRGLRDQRLRVERVEPGAHEPEPRHGVPRRRRHPSARLDERRRRPAGTPRRSRSASEPVVPAGVRRQR